jgi:hypothetical protein
MMLPVSVGGSLAGRCQALNWAAASWEAAFYDEQPASFLEPGVAVYGKQAQHLLQPVNGQVPSIVHPALLENSLPPKEASPGQ